MFRMTNLTGAVVCFSAIMSAPSAARASAEVYKKVLPGTAWVVADGDEFIAGRTFSSGSGVVIDTERRLVVTNYHVVEEREEVLVFFPTGQGKQLQADPLHYHKNAKKLGLIGTVVLRDPLRDLAIIQLPSLPAGVR